MFSARSCSPLEMKILAPLMAYGLLLTGEGVARVAPVARPYAMPAVAAAVLAACTFTVETNYSRLDQSGNHVAHTFAEDILASLEPNTILLASGDHVVLPVAYVQIVEGMRPDVTLVMTTLLPADWYVRELRRRFPDLKVPFDASQSQRGAMKAFFDANSDRPIAVVGNLEGDKELEGHYWFYDRGIVSRCAPLSEDRTITDLIAMYNDLAPKYRVPPASSIRAGTFEKALLGQYALPTFRIAKEYENARRYEDAKEWYRRSLAVNPEFREAREGLARVSRPQ